MEVSKLNQKLSAFLESGIFPFEDSDSVFIDPVRVLNQPYTRFMVSPSSYYSRFFESSDETHQQSSNSRKRKRKEKKPYTLNERERAADWRHQVKNFYTIPCLVNGDSELRTIVASISLWLTTTGEWKCPPEVEELRCFVEEELFPARGVKCESRWFIDKIIGPFSSSSIQMHYFGTMSWGGQESKQYQIIELSVASLGITQGTPLSEVCLRSIVQGMVLLAVWSYLQDKWCLDRFLEETNCLPSKIPDTSTSAEMDSTFTRRLFSLDVTFRDIGARSYSLHSCHRIE